MAGSIRVGNIFVTIGASAAALDRELRKGANKVIRFGAQLQSMGTQLALSLSAPLVATGGAALKMAATFDKAFTQSTAIMGDLSTTMREDLAGAAREVAKETAFSAAEAAEGLFFLASAGLTAEQSMAALPVVARFATAGQTDLARATEQLADAQSALGLSSQNAAVHAANLARVADVLTKANVISQGSVAQFADALTNKAAASLRQVNKDIEEGVAVLAVYAQQGIKGAEAGQFLFQVLRDLQVAALKNEQGFRRLGIEVFDSVTEDMRHMADIIGDLEKRLGGMTAAGRRAALSTLELQDRSIGALLPLIGFSEQIRRFEGELRSAQGVTDQIARDQLQNLADRFTLAKNRVADVAIELGNFLAPAAEKALGIFVGMTEALGSIIKLFNQLPDIFKNLVTVTGALVASLGPLLIIVGTLIRTFQVIKAVIVPAGIFLASFAKGPVGIATLALSAAASAFGLFGDKAAEAQSAGAVFAETVVGINAAVSAMRRELADSRDRVVELTDEIAAAEARLRQARSIVGGADPGRIRDLEKLVEGLREELARIERQSQQTARAIEDNLVQSALQQWSDALAEAETQHRATGNEIETLNAKILATKTAIAQLVKSVPEGSDVVQDLRNKLAGMLSELQRLNLEQEKTKKGTADVAAAFQEWNQSMTVAAVAGDFLADRNGALREQISLTEQTIRSVTSNMLSAGKSQEEVGQATEFLRTHLSLLREELILQSSQWTIWGEQMNAVLTNAAVRLVEFGDLVFDAFQGVADTIGQSLGRALFEGESFFKNLGRGMQQVGVQFVGALASMGIQLLAFAILSKVVSKSFFASFLGVESAKAYAAAYASAIAGLPFPINAAVAPIFATAVVAGLQAGALPFAAAEEGGFTTGTGFALLHPRELVAPEPMLERIVADAGDGRVQQVNVFFDGKMLLRKMVRGMPEEIQVALGNRGMF